jgi:hypothetical protein
VKSAEIDGKKGNIDNLNFTNQSLRQNRTTNIDIYKGDFFDILLYYMGG